MRFGLALHATFEKPEERAGPGYFRSALVKLMKDSPLAGEPVIREVLKYVSTGRPHQGERYEDYREAIKQAVSDRLRELREDLGYPPETAGRIFVGAVAYYLDERFSVIVRKKRG